MWKESIIVGLISLFHHERRKHNIADIPNDRRKKDIKLTVCNAQKKLEESLEKFSETVILHKKK